MIVCDFCTKKVKNTPPIIISYYDCEIITHSGDGIDTHPLILDGTKERHLELCDKCNKLFIKKLNNIINALQHESSPTQSD